MEELRRQAEPRDGIPYAVDSRIRTLHKETKSNDEEIRLLQQIISSVGNLESERYLNYGG